jgi:hypothetical protein
MRWILNTCIVFLIVSPLLAGAREITLGNEFPFSDIGTFVGGIISNTNVETSSSGGVVSHGNVEVTGNAGASADVRTIMRSGSRGTTYRSVITTESDGAVNTETIEKTLPLSGRTEIRIATSSKAGNVKIRAYIGVDSVGTKVRAPSATSRSIDLPATPTISSRTSTTSSNFFGRQKIYIASFWNRIHALLTFL